VPGDEAAWQAGFGAVAMKSTSIQDNPVSSQERLESWKEIAAFLGKGVRTVQRWERTEELPVRRHVHERGGTVYAYKSEILDWYRSRQTRLEGEADVEAAAGDVSPASRPKEPRPRVATPTRIGLGLLLLAFVVAVAVVMWPRPRPFAGLATPLLSVVGRASQSVLSPDGRRVAFVWNGEREFGNLDLYVKDTASGPPVRLTDHPNNEHSPAWSADGMSLAFLRDKEGVFVMAAQGRKLERIIAQAAGAVYGVGLAWSADGRHLYYSERVQAAEPLRIFRVAIAGGSVERVTNPTDGAGDMYPSLAPNSHQLAFIRQARSLAADVYVVDLGSSGRAAKQARRLTSIGSRIAGLDWLPQGDGLVFSSDQSGGRRLWLWRSGWRTRVEPLALAGEEAFQPSIARRGGVLVYSRRYWPTGIWRIDIGGDAPASPVKLIASVREDTEPACSPDGSRAAFVSNRTGSTEIWTSRADGTHATQLTTFGGPPTHGPVWSPDGRQIAFHSGPERSSSVFVIPAEGGAPRRITPPGMHSVQPSWSPDGRVIFFTSNQSGRDQIWRIALDGAGLRQITDAGGVQPQLSQDGRWIYFKRDGLWRIPVGGGGEVSVLDGPVGTYAISQRGIYFDRGFGDYSKPEIHILDFETNKQKLVMRFERRKAAGLSISADGGSLLVPLNDRQSSELVLVRSRQ
jgi:Tol biopolymer transport system component